MSQTGLWTYPWTLEREGIADACERIAATGLGAVNVAAHYHSVRSMQARYPEDLFHSYPGGCYFKPDERFGSVPIEPPVNDVGSWNDPLAEVVDVAHEYGMDANAWTVLMHNSRLGAENPEYQIESAFGDAHAHSLCPSHPAVKDYFAAVVSTIRDRGVDAIHLESIGFQSAFHDHGPRFGHDKRQTITTNVEEFLLSQCFCDGCQMAAASHPIDLDAARDRVRELLDASLADPTHSPAPSIDDLADREPLVVDLLSFRASVIDGLLERLADASGSTPLEYYAMEAYGLEPAGLAPAGVTSTSLETHVEGVTALCYVGETDVARTRIEALERAVDLPIGAGITLDPDLIDGADTLENLLETIHPRVDGTVSIYHHSLLTEAHFEWIENALE